MADGRKSNLDPGLAHTAYPALPYKYTSVIVQDAVLTTEIRAAGS